MTNTDAERVSDIVAYRELAERCLEHMGKADFQTVLNDCHAAARALRSAADIIEAQSKALAEARHELWTTSIALGVIAKWPRFYFNRFYVEEWVLRTVVILRRWGVREPDAALTVHGSKSIKKSRLARSRHTNPGEPND